MRKLPIAVLISGSGSNLQALIDACKDEQFPATIVMVFSNKDSAYGLTRARNAGIPTQVLSHKAFPSREAFDEAMHDILAASGAELLCMAGFMRLLTVGFVQKWHNRLINIHPSLLPSFKGLHAQEQALQAGVKIAGCTVHFVREAMDSGPIIIQGAVPVRSQDTTESLTANILKVEHQCYPKAVKMLAEKTLRIEGDTLIFDGLTDKEWLVIDSYSA